MCLPRLPVCPAGNFPWGAHCLLLYLLSHVLQPPLQPRFFSPVSTEMSSDCFFLFHSRLFTLACAVAPGSRDSKVRDGL